MFYYGLIIYYNTSSDDIYEETELVEDTETIVGTIVDPEPIITFDNVDEYNVDYSCGMAMYSEDGGCVQ